MTPSRSAQAAAALVIAGAITVAAALLPPRLSGAQSAPTDASAIANADAAAFTPSNDLGDQIIQLQQHLAAQPADARSWGVLALLLIEQGRVTADPASYAASKAASDQSLAEQPRNNDLAHAASGALLSAKHLFTAALAEADRALTINPYSRPALGVRVDALTELGRLPAALRAARVFDRLQPGLAATTRLAYQSELRANEADARRFFASALTSAIDPNARAFVEYHLGEIARRAGDLSAADAHYRAALQAVPADPNALAGRARVLALRGHVDRAITILREVVTRVPLLEHLIALGELYEISGDRGAAQQQYAVVRASADLARAAGIRPDLELAWFEADHGDPVAALQLGRAEWKKRHSPLVADALGWALHMNGLDERALHYAKLATEYGGDARSWHHRGAVEAALGLDRMGIKHLHKALRLDGGYAPWPAQQLHATLGELEERS
ncbi:MAG: hypothetical protein LH645_06315 [Actinomycetia bacterium]|nr:hypothetical protein [Actinomycetes bacterium]